MTDQGNQDDEEMALLPIHPRVSFKSPVLSEIAKEGGVAVDMHYHTTHSDGHSTVRDLLRLARSTGVGVAITDHNEASGAVEACGDAKGSTFVLPGMEVSAMDGPHILVYFYAAGDLAEFHRQHILPARSKSPYMAIHKSTEEVLDAAGEYSCLVVAAHPYGYVLFNKGVQKCVERAYLPPAILSAFDGVEVLCGSMGRSLNKRAVELAESGRHAITGGSDGHLASDLGGVVTWARAETPDEFLDSVAARKNYVVGEEKSIAGKCIAGPLILTKYIRYTIPSLRIHYEQNIPRVHRFLRETGRKRR